MPQHEKTLQAIFEKPTRSNIAWREIEGMFRHYGGRIIQGKGSRVAVILNGVRGAFHRPHPRKDASKGCVESVRDFLENVGVTPNV